MMNRMFRLTAILLFILSSTQSLFAAIGSHPRIWITSGLITEWQQKACLNPSGVIPSCTPDPEWTNVIKVDADGYKNSTNLIPYWPVTSIANGNPIVFTVSGTMPHWHASNVCFAGATGNWAAINTANTRPDMCAIPTWVDATHFSIPGDSTGYGTSAGNITNLVYIFDGEGGAGYVGVGTNYYTVVADGNSGASTSQTTGQYRGSGWYTFVVEMYITWQVTGDASYVTPVTTWLDYIGLMGASTLNSAVEPSSDYSSGYSDRFVMLGVATAFDWFYAQLSVGEKAAVPVTLNNWYADETKMFYDLYGCNPYPGTCIYNYSEGNFWTGHLLGVGLSGLATYGDNPLDSGASNPLVDDAAAKFTQWFGVAATAPDGFWSGGAPLESFNYGANTANRILLYMLAVKTATGVDNTQPYANNVVKYQLYALAPDRWRAPIEGDYPGTPGMMPGDGFNLGSYIATSPYNAYAQFAWGNFNTSCLTYTTTCSVIQSGNHLDHYFWFNPTNTATDYRSVPISTYYISQGDWHMYNRSDWTDSATWSEFNGLPTKYVDHQFQSFGNVDVKRGQDYLIVDAQEYSGTDGITGPPSPEDHASGLANAMFFCDSKVYSFSSCPPQTVVPTYYGGGGLWAPYVRPLSKATANFSFEENDFTYAYDINLPVPANRTMRFYYRSFAWFSDGTMVVQDTSQVKVSSYTQMIRWNLNPTDGVPVNTSGVVKQTAGTSAIYIDPVYPASPSITISTAPATGGPTSATYQIDVTNGSAATDQKMLTVLYPTAKATAFPSTNALATIAANWQGVEINDASPEVFLEPYDVTDNGNNTYTKNLHNTVTFTTTHSGTASYLVAGMASGTYTVTGNCLTGCTRQVVGTDGTLYFTGTSGAYSIDTAPTAPSTAPSITLFTSTWTSVPLPSGTPEVIR